MDGAIKELLGGDLGELLTSCFEQMSWADDEIATAMRRHPAEADTIWHSFTLLRATHERMTTEFVYRSHARELLDRVASGEDTRRGTAAEVILVISDASTVTPLRSVISGLAARLWKVAGFAATVGDPWDEVREHHEALSSSAIDDAEAFTRAKAADPDRVLGKIECKGLHHGDAAVCRYASVVMADVA